MHYDYKTSGTCSKQISFDIEDGRVRNLRFTGGCGGLTQGVAALAEGMPVDEVIAKIEGIRCSFKKTSCPDQLAQALHTAMGQHA